ncbi:MAG: sporulation transcription factor Spo0A [Clostridia bacterium]|nr:sporulation transcription factor Spo0A [Clostridia bacterium]
MAYKVLLADDCFGGEADARRILKGYDMKAFFCGRDGREVIKSIETIKPDAVVMNMSMRSVDACGVLTLLKGRTAAKFVVVYSGSESGPVDEAMELGAEYCLPLPIDAHLFAARLDSIRIRAALNALDAPPSAKRDTETAITELLHMLAVPAHIKGYQYLREAISLVVRDMDLINSVTKELYPTVAKRFGTTPSRAERAIRHAIEVAWDRGEVEVMNKFFGYTIRADRGKPTNSEFIALVADRLRLKEAPKKP